jgi:hypothetical protein
MNSNRDLGLSLLVCGLLAAAARLLAGGAGWQAPPVALLAIIAIGLELRRTRQPRQAFPDVMLAAAALLLIAGPATGFAVLALIPLAAIAARRGPHGAIAAVMLVGLALWALQGGPFGEALAGPVIAVETRLLEFVLKLAGVPVARDGTMLLLADGRSLVILRGCSLESVAVPTLLGALAVRRLAQPEEAWPRPAAVFLPLALVALLNTVRLLMMCMSAEAYHALHGALGLKALEVVMVLPIAAALLPTVRRRTATEPAIPWRGAVRPMAITVAAAAVCIGFALQHMATPEGRNPLAERGFAPAGRVALVTGGALTVEVWRNAGGCGLFAADFEVPDATLPLMRKHLAREFEAGWTWWLGARQMPEMSPFEVNALRIASKLVSGRAPKSLITLDPARCLIVHDGRDNQT